MKLNEFRGYDSWMDKHITVKILDLTGEFEGSIIYVAWDETGANVIRASTSLQEVVSALKEYAERL